MSPSEEATKRLSSRDGVSDAHGWTGIKKRRLKLSTAGQAVNLRGLVEENGPARR